MSSLDLDFDTQMNNLEEEWRQVYDDSMLMRAEYQALTVAKGNNAGKLKALSERIARAEEKKARVMAKIERLEDVMLGED